MRIAHFSYSDTIGAFGAAYELHKYLCEKGIDSTLFVRKKTRNDKSIVEIPYDNDLEERICRLIGFKNVKNKVRKGFEINNYDNVGIKLDNYTESLLKEYDLFHLHWCTQLLSLCNIRELLQYGKPIVWTIHDFHPITATCHVPDKCTYYQTGCHDCPQLFDDNELVKRIFSEKESTYKNKIDAIVACDWMYECTRKSVLFSSSNLYKVPIGVDNRVYYMEKEKEKLREKYGFDKDCKIILFGAAYLDMNVKGYMDFSKIVNMLKENNKGEKIKFVSFGVCNNDYKLNPEIIHMGFIQDKNKLREIYNISDAFLFLSTQDTFGMTAVESMFCGTPVIAYDVCAMKEIIADGINGYKVHVSNIDEIVDRIQNIINGNINPVECCEYTVQRYSLSIETNLIIKVYKDEIYKRSGVKKNKQHFEGNDDSGMQSKSLIGEYNEYELSEYNNLFLDPIDKVNYLEKKNIISHANKLILYGAGRQATAFIEILKEKGYTIEEIWDSDKNKQGLLLDDIKITVPSKYIKLNSIILISIVNFESAARTLEGLGYVLGDNFF